VPVSSRTTDAFEKLDADRDGVLSRTELAPHPKAAHMAMVDGNGDGVLSRDEFDELQGM
jgi:Ca2+-binding EF-hand superfamily protein